MANPTREHDALIGAYKHLDRFPRADEALLMLRKIASLVKPIMRKRGWMVGTLSEFFPAETNMLGLNIDAGREICLRLRYAGDKTQFMPLEDIVDTMLHELSHIVRGPHDQVFHKQWNELRDEYEGLKMKGYSGEGFLGHGQRLGGRSVPVHEWRRQARAEAERRRRLEQQMTPGGHRLGGALVPRGVDMRQVIADAADKRGRRTRGITEGCASGTKGAERMRDEASKNATRTKSDDDETNDRAIAQALWELLQEEENENAGLGNRELMTEPSGGLQWTPEEGLQEVAQPMQNSSSVPHSVPPHSRSIHSSFRPTPQRNPNGRPISRIVLEAEARQRQSKRAKVSQPTTESSSGSSRTPAHAVATVEPTPVWICAICTLENPDGFLACDACGVERTPDAQSSVTMRSPSPKSRQFSSDNGSSSLLSDVQRSSGTLGWTCRRCGTFMENQWWTCSFCGLMKASSASTTTP